MLGVFGYFGFWISGLIFIYGTGTCTGTTGTTGTGIGYFNLYLKKLNKLNLSNFPIRKIFKNLLNHHIPNIFIIKLSQISSNKKFIKLFIS